MVCQVGVKVDSIGRHGERTEKNENEEKLLFKDGHNKVPRRRRGDKRCIHGEGRRDSERCEEHASHNW